MSFSDLPPSVHYCQRGPWKNQTTSIAIRYYGYTRSDDPLKSVLNSESDTGDLSALPVVFTAQPTSQTLIADQSKSTRSSGVFPALQQNLDREQVLLDNARTNAETFANLYGEASETIPGLDAFAANAETQAYAALQAQEATDIHVQYLLKFGYTEEQAAAALANQAAAHAAYTAADAAFINATSAAGSARTLRYQYYVQWGYWTSEVELYQGHVARWAYAIQVAASNAGSAPETPPDDYYAVYTYDPGNASSSLRDNGYNIAGTVRLPTTNNPQDPTTSCVLGEYKDYGCYNGEYQWRFNLGYYERLALLNAGVTSVRLTWYERTTVKHKKLIPFTTVPDYCMPYNVTVDDPDTPDEVTLEERSATFDLMSGEGIALDDSNPETISYQYTSDLFSANSPGVNSNDVLIDIVGSWTMPSTLLLMDKRGAKIHRTGFFENTTDGNALASTVGRYRKEEAHVGSVASVREITSAPDPTVGVYEYHPLVLPEIPKVGLDNPLDASSAVASDTDVVVMSATQRLVSQPAGMTLTLQDPITTAEIATAVATAVETDWGEGGGGGSGISAQLSALSYAPADGNYCATQRCRFKVQYQGLPTLARAGDSVPFRVKQTVYKDGGVAVSYLDYSLSLTTEILGAGLPDSDWIEPPMPDPGSAVKYEGAPVDEMEYNSRIYDGGARLSAPGYVSP